MAEKKKTGGRAKSNRDVKKKRANKPPIPYAVFADLEDETGATWPSEKVSKPLRKKHPYKMRAQYREGSYKQDPKTMSDMQMHRVHDSPLETVHLSGDDTGALVVEKSTRHPYRKMESGAKKRLSRKKGVSVKRKEYANGGSVRAARF